MLKYANNPDAVDISDLLETEKVTLAEFEPLPVYPGSLDLPPSERDVAGLWRARVHRPAGAIEEMFAYHDVGFTTWDLADHYGPAEDFIGSFRREFAARHGVERLSEIQAFTKWVPAPGRITRQIVEDAIGTRSARMGVECLDLLQFHWWDYTDESYLDALRHLADLQHEGKIRHLALTNFDTERLCVITDQVRGRLEPGTVFAGRSPPRSPHGHVLPRTQNFALAYGTLLGGLLSEKYLGRPEPRRPELNTASLQKYKNMIDAWGGWSLFQELLAVLKQIADKHRREHRQCRYPLHSGPPGGGRRHHRRAARRSAAYRRECSCLRLRARSDDLAVIEPILAKSRDLTQVIGDCGDEYR